MERSRTNSHLIRRKIRKSWIPL
uniref:Uncharacterized protein n=1 Tax=Salix viminalis TaxID=40686 RepID=A0A6N2K9D8_SALVM